MPTIAVAAAAALVGEEAAAEVVDVVEGGTCRAVVAVMAVEVVAVMAVVVEAVMAVAVEVEEAVGEESHQDSPRGLGGLQSSQETRLLLIRI
eukprot:CAMPEP_0178655058 /NCGR_PEP_ID=MMETSP0698-20121128/24081_1 /TAXON_ID=265572 /ORGANISM="Extubocellulus spinifer, Strain CCMP396" /LENGTH=91 /DNA_ID=CAMNT_0020297007 /DNA_START=14 /DNA_END=286 /DNA_ORIENTATION=+